MLPDFPALKLDLLKSQSYAVTHEHAREPLLSKIASHVMALHIPRGSVPVTLIQGSRWLLPFALTYPHRVTRELSGVIDALIGESADLVL